MVNEAVTERLEQLARRKDEARAAGSAQAVERQRARGKMTARERVAALLDPGSFTELDMLARHRATGMGMEDNRPYTDGVISGFGTIGGRRVGVFSQDFTVFGGSLGEVHAEKIQKVMDLAVSAGIPVIGLNDGAGARIQEGVVALDMYGRIFARNVAASGVVPQISVMLGPCAGGAVYSPALTDFVVMVRGASYMAITGPDVVRAVTGEEVSIEELGGATTHATKSGVCSFIVDDEHACLAAVRALLSYLPSNAGEVPPRVDPGDDPGRATPEVVGVVPADANAAYDVRDIVVPVVDRASFMEYAAEWATNIVCGFARVDGHPVGVVANQPAVLAGVLDIDASEKAARFVRTCDAFGLPLVCFVDVPGYLPGIDEELHGLVRSGAKLLYAWAEASVARVQFVIRKAYGGASVAMNSKAVGADLAWAWPSAEFSVMDPQGAVEILHRRELASAADPEDRRSELLKDYAERHLSPYQAAERGYVDDVIDPADTRRVLVRSLELLATKRRQRAPRKHPNVPL